MAQVVLILSPSGGGKSSSMRNFAHDELALVNVINKPLPFKGKFDSTLATDNYDKIKLGLAGTSKNAIVIDDAGYLITNFFMRNHANSIQRGNNAFAIYNQMADDFWSLIEFCKKQLSPQKIVYFMMHEDNDELNGVKPKTIGKLLDDKVNILGLMSIVLRAAYDNGEYVFHTNAATGQVSKSPIGMFDDIEGGKSGTIPNDLKAVDAAIRAYYELPPLRAVPGEPQQAPQQIAQPTNQSTNQSANQPTNQGKEQ